MNLEEKIFYNKASATKLNWSPTWFGAKGGIYDEGLVEAIVDWQKERGLSGDGLVGPSTFRRA